MIGEILVRNLPFAVPAVRLVGSVLPSALLAFAEAKPSLLIQPPFYLAELVAGRADHTIIKLIPQGIVLRFLLLFFEDSVDTGPFPGTDHIMIVVFSGVDLRSAKKAKAIFVIAFA